MKAVVLHSGGLDSTVCLLLAIEQNREVISVGVDYGQRHRIELDYAAAQCRRFEVDRRLLRVEWDKPIRQTPVSRSLEEMRSSISPAFLPGRNAVFLALACAEAAGIAAQEVWIGINSIDFSGYPDCTPPFLAAYQAMNSIAIPEGPRIIAPLVAKSKAEIALEASRLGLIKGDTWSCYQPSFSATGISPCGKCDACILHEHAWQKAKAGG